MSTFILFFMIYEMYKGGFHDSDYISNKLRYTNLRYYDLLIL